MLMSLYGNFIHCISASKPGRHFTRQAVKDAAKAGVVSFTGSLVTKQLNQLELGPMAARTAGTGAVRAAYNALQREHKQALREAYQSVVSALLQQVTTLPISVGRTYFAADNQLFGSKVESFVNQRDGATYSLSKTWEV